MFCCRCTSIQPEKLKNKTAKCKTVTKVTALIENWLRPQSRFKGQQLLTNILPGELSRSSKAVYFMAIALCRAWSLSQQYSVRELHQGHPGVAHVYKDAGSLGRLQMVIYDIIVSAIDNGPQFVSEQISSFCLKNGTRHVWTAPYHVRTDKL